MKNARMIMVSLVTLTTFSCGILKKNDRSSADADPVVTAADETKTVDPKIDLTGKDLYGKLCASCHQALDKTDVPKAPLARINDAIAKVPTMAGLKDTPTNDLQAIAAALSEVSPGKGKGKAGEDEGTED